MELYCRMCGSPLAMEDPPGFDSETGKRIGTLKCPKLTCERGCEEHGGHHFPRPPRQTFWEYLTQPKEPLSDIICTRCGCKESVGNGGWY